MKPLNREEIILREKEIAETRWATTKELAKEAQMNREYLLKLSAMKKHMFGKFMVKVPVFKIDRFRDTPLSSSVAKSIEKTTMSMAELAVQESQMGRIQGETQNIDGHMIPRVIEKRVITEAPTGQTAKNKSLLDEKDPAMRIASDSSLHAVISLCIVIIGSTFFTYYTVPIIGSTIEQISPL
eukprot:CAMPEP_0197834142 /NCGR_PEP_ID=MMETSP1437-20131217/21337_1 /TAXON_ID=49252 ORGANISM="Eucampia antarctica, Strain CCMP1452" /NCGR_SAMPLE_ID=MMETSP1437 /ASSEMBLY_ACC=CAM_ASM_001096 /LENGTH=182 /DNA_ID=CAMNT_0043438619 /DNA_START=87 /DNA_END=635 /DNA_ORIENTATION=-